MFNFNYQNDKIIDKTAFLLIRKSVLSEIWNIVKNKVGFNEFQVCGVCDIVNVNNFTFIYPVYIYSHKQRVSGAMVRWDSNELFRKAFAFREKIICHLSAHRHLGHFGFSAVDRGERGILRRFESANIFSSDIILNCDDDDVKIVDFEFSKWQGKERFVYKQNHYFILNDLDLRENGNVGNDISIFYDLRLQKEVDCVLKVLFNYETNYDYMKRRKINKTLFYYLLDFYVNSRNVILDIDSDDFEIYYQFPWEEKEKSYWWRWWYGEGESFYF